MSWVPLYHLNSQKREGRWRSAVSDSLISLPKGPALKLAAAPLLFKVRWQRGWRRDGLYRLSVLSDTTASLLPFTYCPVSLLMR